MNFPENYMAPFLIDLEKTNTQSSLVRLEPALNAFGSMLLVAAEEEEPGIHEWVSKTRARMSSEERARHKLVMIGLHYAILPHRSGLTFDEYLDRLESTSASKLKDRLLYAYSKIKHTDEAKKEADTPIQWDKVLASPKSYVSFLRQRFGEEATDQEMESQAYQYVIDPEAMKKLIITHLRWFWEMYMQGEWIRVRPMLEASARAFNQIDLSDKSRAETVQFITGKEINELKWGSDLTAAKELVFIPNVHFGPYMRATRIGDSFYIYFGARLPEGSDVRVPELDRAEIVARLSALADDTRLNILQMIVEKGQMRSQEIMEATNLSQPSVSRYLTQLTATGYLQERRESGGKVYVLNRDRVEKTLKAVHAFLLRGS
jgi:DNA-binding transcriptional ArsR family regulator